jgi:hypothetical protein
MNKKNDEGEEISIIGAVEGSKTLSQFIQSFVDTSTTQSSNLNWKRKDV